MAEAEKRGERQTTLEGMFLDYAHVKTAHQELELARKLRLPVD